MLSLASQQSFVLIEPCSTANKHWHHSYHTWPQSCREEFNPQFCIQCTVEGFSANLIIYLECEFNSTGLHWERTSGHPSSFRKMPQIELSVHIINCVPLTLMHLFLWIDTQGLGITRNVPTMIFDRSSPTTSLLLLWLFLSRFNRVGWPRSCAI